MTTDQGSIEPSSSSWFLVGIAWLAVSIPLFWGIWQTVKKAAVLFR